MKHQLKQAVSSTASGLLKQAIGRRGERASGGIVNPDLVVQVIDDWPAVPWNAAQRMTEKYGLPAEATPSRLIWYENGRWLRSIVYRDEVPYDFPKPHTDVMARWPVGGSLRSSHQEGAPSNRRFLQRQQSDQRQIPILLEHRPSFLEQGFVAMNAVGLEKPIHEIEAAYDQNGVMQRLFVPPGIVNRLRIRVSDA